MYAERKSRCGAKNILECDKNLKSEIKEHLENKMSLNPFQEEWNLKKRNSIIFNYLSRNKNRNFRSYRKEVLVRKGKVKPRNTEETRGKISDRKGIEEKTCGSKWKNRNRTFWIRYSYREKQEWSNINLCRQSFKIPDRKPYGR